MRQRRNKKKDWGKRGKKEEEEKDKHGKDVKGEKIKALLITL